ncbi:MAG: tyrosine--tRNA ligase [Candidatus Wildermuthbacteria bacterium]|nr:tyrosine--tRNA ligase [Candidatus Wildermuthbacteria bacterium]
MAKSSIQDTLSRQVAEILPGKEGLEKLMRKKKIRLYLGIDPTSPFLHLGHAVILRKLRQFQDLGHEVVLLFGTFTAKIGDPSGKDKRREPLSDAQIKQNMATYKNQAAKILDISKVTIRKNGEWLDKMKFDDVLRLTSQVTVSQLLERDMFQQRIKEGNEIWTHELLYPLMQGYDSVAMDVDLEVGGTDQTFNMLVGRKLQKTYNNKEKYVLTVPLLLGLDGRKMSKSLGNTVNILDSPKDMYGKIMSLQDNLVVHYFEMCTNVAAEKVAAIEKGMKPRDMKAALAREIVGLYYGAKEANAAEEEFNNVFREKQTPSEVTEIKLSEKELSLVDLLIKTGLAKSKSEARRLIEQGGMKINNQVQEDANRVVSIASGMVVQAGKRRFVKIT